MLIRSPFEQFELVSLVSVGFGSFDISFTNSTLIGLIGLIFLVCILRMVFWRGGYVIAGRWQLVFEGIYKLILRMLKDSMGKAGSKYISLVLTLFLYILVMNLSGMIPYSYTVTSQLVITFVLALGVWIGKLFVGLKKHGIGLLGMFIPVGLPFGLVPFFVVIELIGFVIPVISLSVRLFANMMSGHVLLKVLFGFTWLMFLSGGLLALIDLLPLTVLICLLGLETAVALIQAYVFTLLTCIYIGDMEHGGH